MTNTAHTPVILLLSQDSQLHYLLDRYMENCGCRLILVDPGTSLTDHAVRYKPDAIIVEVPHPGAVTDELLQTLRSEAATRSIPIILYAVNDTFWADLKTKVAGYLVEPILFQDFVSLLKRVGIRITQSQAKEV